MAANNLNLQICVYLILFLTRLPFHTCMSNKPSCNLRSSCGCSKALTIVQKITNGKAAEIETWPWMVSISLADKFFCGGAILSESWIITAAHCAQRTRASQITIYAGSIERWSGTQERKILQKYIHPNFNRKLYTNDIALLELKEPLDLTYPLVKPICLGSSDQETLSELEWPPINTPVVAIGWGRLSEAGPTSAVLQEVTVTTIDQNASNCQSIIHDWQTQFCAGAAHEYKDTCQGDSGGPLMMTDSNGRWILVGITSYGYGCARLEYAGVYTRVSVYFDWIKEHVKQSYFDSTPWLSLMSHDLLSNTCASSWKFSFSFVFVLSTWFVEHFSF